MHICFWRMGVYWYLFEYMFSFNSQKSNKSIASHTKTKTIKGKVKAVNTYIEKFNHKYNNKIKNYLSLFGREEVMKAVDAYDAGRVDSAGLAERWKK